MATQQPTSLTIRMYQVGFGDCFLLTFAYPADSGGDRHVLIDFGTTKLPEHAPQGQMAKIAEDIRTICNGKLHAVVATHRHQDHISGFATNDDKTATGNIIAGLEPDLVIQPWTEHPDAAEDAQGLTAAAAPVRAFVQSLSHMHTFAAALRDEARARQDRRLAKNPKARISLKLAEARFIGEVNLKNLSAVENLMDMGRRGKAEYVCHGYDTELKKLLPGVNVRVLGPPTLEQSQTIKKQRSKDADEFWHLQARYWQALADGAPQPGGSASDSPFPHITPIAPRKFPTQTRWFIPKVEDLREDQMLELVRILDKAMNNTSVILLFEVGGRGCLFPGDAQIENWSYALKAADDKDEVATLLSGVRLYKVGHHGSLNATPKSLWKLFGDSRGVGDDRLRTMVSTLKGKHGRTASGTEVPRVLLVEELKAKSEFHSSETIARQSLCEVVTIQF